MPRGRIWNTSWQDSNLRGIIRSTNIVVAKQWKHLLFYDYLYSLMSSFSVSSHLPIAQVASLGPRTEKLISRNRAAEADAVLIIPHSRQCQLFP